MSPDHPLDHPCMGRPTVVVTSEATPCQGGRNPPRCRGAWPGGPRPTFPHFDRYLYWLPLPGNTPRDTIPLARCFTREGCG